MLATVRIGAIHSRRLRRLRRGRAGRPDPCQRLAARLHRRRHLPQGQGRRPAVDRRRRALRHDAPSDVEHVVVLRRGAGRARLRDGRDLDWDEFLAGGEGQRRRRRGHGGRTSRRSSSPPRARPPSRSSPSTPTAATRSTSHAMGRLGVRPRAGDDVWWSTSDIGWVVGHSYIVYAPLMAGATTIAYEGALDHPDADDLRGRSSSDDGVTGVFTSPTAVRLLMRYGEAGPRRHDLASLERVVLRRRGAQRAGLGVAAADASSTTASRSSTTCGRPRPAGRSSATRTASALLPIKPGSAGVAAARHRGGRRRRPTASRSAPGEKGIMRDQAAVPRADRRRCGASPSATSRDYWERIPGGYYVGDAAHIDEDGYVWFAGRADEIIKIAGHRHRHDRGRDRVPAPPGGRRGRRHRPSRTSCAARSSRRSSCSRPGHEPSDELRPGAARRPCAASSGRSR